MALLAAACAVAAPSGHDGDYCLCAEEAHRVAKNFQQMFSNYTDELALRILSPDFSDFTDSVSWLMNNGTECPSPLGTVTFPTRESVMKAQSGQPVILWQNLEVFWDCKRLFIRWESAQSPQTVRGIAIVRTTKNPNPTPQVPYLIQHIFSEFNTGAWLVNRGDYIGTAFASQCDNVTGPNATGPAKSSRRSVGFIY